MQQSFQQAGQRGAPQARPPSYDVFGFALCRFAFPVTFETDLKEEELRAIIIQLYRGGGQCDAGTALG